jgi:hypothetical protein
MSHLLPGLNQIDLYQYNFPFMSAFWDATIRDGVLLTEAAHDYPKPAHRPQPSRQIVGTIELVRGCDSDRDDPYMALCLVSGTPRFQNDSLPQGPVGLTMAG